MDAGAVNRFLNEYLEAFAACVHGEREIGSLLAYYGVPLIITSDDGVIALTTDSDVVTVIQSQVDGLRGLRYRHTEVLQSQSLASTRRQPCIAQAWPEVMTPARKSTARQSLTSSPTVNQVRGSPCWPHTAARAAGSPQRAGTELETEHPPLPVLGEGFRVGAMLHNHHFASGSRQHPPPKRGPLTVQARSHLQ